MEGYMYKYVFEYPAITWKRNGKYIADCKALNIVGVGYSENEAINNLQIAANQYLYDFEVVILPIKKQTV
jgi:predicted RNase H-like HicB family nuclease